MGNLRRRKNLRSLLPQLGIADTRANSSVGRAPPLQGGGRGIVALFAHSRKPMDKGFRNRCQAAIVPIASVSALTPYYRPKYRHPLDRESVLRARPIISMCAFTLIVATGLSGCGIGHQNRPPGCVPQTILQTDRNEGTVRGSVITLDDGHSYTYLRRDGTEPPVEYPSGSAVVVCPGDSPGIYDISLDEEGGLFLSFRRR